MKYCTVPSFKQNNTMIVTVIPLIPYTLAREARADR